MRCFSRTCALVAFAMAMLAGSQCHAFYAWAIKEVFTSADGAVQFIEFFTTEPDQDLLVSHNIAAKSDGVEKEFPFPSNLPSDTAGKHFLVATPAFAATPGAVTPDYVLPSGNFFNRNAANIVLNYAHDFDILTLAGSALPADGRHSLNDADLTLFGPDVLSIAVNSPTNFAGQVGSINLAGGGPTPGDFNGDSAVNGLDLAIWRNNFGAVGAPTTTQGNADGDGDVDGRDFLIWQRNVGASAVAAVAAVPEPATALLAMLAGVTLAVLRQRRVER